MANEQLLYGGSWKTAYANYEFPRGDDRQLVFSHLLGAAENIQSARLELELNGTAIVQKTLADHASQWDFSTSGQGTFTFDNLDTAGLDTGTYDYAVELVNLAGLVYTPIVGQISLTSGVVDDDVTAAYLSWTTLETYNTAFDGLLGMVYAGLVAEDTDSGSGTIEVSGASDLFEAADTIWVQLGNPGTATYESHTVDSVSGDVITLDATTLGDDVAAGNVVQLGVAA